MSEFRSTLDAIGLGGLIRGLERCDPADRDYAIEDASRVIPETLIRQSGENWRRSILRCVIALTNISNFRDVLLLGNDLVLLECLAAVEYNSHIRLLLQPSATKELMQQVELNVPSGLKVEVLTPGQVPRLNDDVSVLVVGFDAGGGYVTLEDAATQYLGAIRGQDFTGDITAVLPLNNVVIRERVTGWRTVPRNQFHVLCHPAGIENITPNI